VQLAEVFDKTQAPDPPPRPKRRRWVLWLLSLAAFAGALVVHGPGVTQVPAQTALVITNDTGILQLGPPAWVARRSSGLAFWVPIGQHAWRLSLRRNRPDPVAFSAHTQDGIALPVRAATLTYRVDPERAAQVFLKYGHKTRGWDTVARGELAWAWAKVIAMHSATDLASAPPDALIPAVRRVLEGRLAGDGFIIEAVSSARWQTPSGIQAGIANRRDRQLKLAAVLDAAAKAVGEAALADFKTQQQWDTERAEQSAILEAQLEAAGMQAAADLEEARRDAESGLIAARSERATLFTRAQVIDAVAPSEAEALAARAVALAEHGGRLLDEAILTHVLPQVDGARTPPVDEDTP
jgi:uncharacterized membrane protein YqiK